MLDWACDAIGGTALDPAVPPPGVSTADAELYRSAVAWSQPDGGRGAAATKAVFPATRADDGGRGSAATLAGSPAFLSTAAAFEALTIIALFRFFNCWVDGAGVAPLSAAGSRQSGRRIARFGYQ